MIRRMFKVAARATFPVFTVVAASVHAGIKYWDNPAFRAFDVGDYAPGAVWHFDGIRNQGADQPHSTTATTWKNLGSSGSSNDMWVRYRNAAGSGVQAETGACKVEGSWTFTAASVAKEDGQLTPVTRYTVERLVNGAWTDATWHDGTSYTYVEGTDPESVRLTWHGRPEGAVILVR